MIAMTAKRKGHGIWGVWLGVDDAEIVINYIQEHFPFYEFATLRLIHLDGVAGMARYEEGREAIEKGREKAYYIGFTRD